MKLAKSVLLLVEALLVVQLQSTSEVPSFHIREGRSAALFGGNKPTRTDYYIFL